jgi:hypothetical protein
MTAFLNSDIGIPNKSATERCHENEDPRAKGDRPGLTILLYCLLNMRERNSDSKQASLGTKYFFQKTGKISQKMLKLHAYCYDKNIRE